MDHETLKARLYEFYDGQTPAEEAQAFYRHLAACAECRAEINSWKTAARALSAIKEAGAGVPEGFADRVMAGIVETAEPAREPVRTSIFEFLGLPRWEILTAACASFMVLSYFSFDYFRYHKGEEGANPIAMIEGEAESENWMILAGLDEPETEVFSHE